MKLSDAMQRYIMDKELENLSPHSIRAYEIALRDMSKELGAMEIDDIDSNCVRKYLIDLKKRDNKKTGKGKLSGETIKNYYVRQKSFFNYCVQQEIIRRNPFDKVARPKYEEKLPETIPDEKIIKLFKILDRKSSFRIKLPFEFLLDTGCRVRELVNLDVEDVHLDDGWAKISGKGRRESIVPIGKKLKIDMHKYQHDIRPFYAVEEEEAFFVSNRGTRYSTIGISQTIRRYLKLAGVDGKLGPHKLRHTFATNFLRNDGDLETCRRILHHRSVKTTQRYLALVPEDIRNAHEKASPLDHIESQIE